LYFFFFFQAEDGIRDFHVTGVQTCALPIFQIELDVELGLERSFERKRPFSLGQDRQERALVMSCARSRGAGAQVLANDLVSGASSSPLTQGRSQRIGHGTLARIDLEGAQVRLERQGFVACPSAQTRSLQVRATRVESGEVRREAERAEQLVRRRVERSDHHRLLQRLEGLRHLASLRIVLSGLAEQPGALALGLSLRRLREIRSATDIVTD